jgi:hypothetical protein
MVGCVSFSSALTLTEGNDTVVWSINMFESLVIERDVTPQNTWNYFDCPVSRIRLVRLPDDRSQWANGANLDKCPNRVKMLTDDDETSSIALRL